MTLADEKEALATIFFECARYERPSTEWIAALDLFATKVAETEREACAALAEACDDADSAARFIRARSNAKLSGAEGVRS